VFADDGVSKDTASIQGHQVVWQEFDGATYSIKLYDTAKRVMQTIVSTSQYVNYPATDGRWVVWGQSPNVHAGQASIEGYDLQNNQNFELFGLGPQQNTNIIPEISGDTVVWQAWRTGNGDIYGATISH
jgi:beta propeller repeat protein